MVLSEILQNVEIIKIYGEIQKNIKKLAYFSKNCTKNSIFFCISGSKVDGSQYVFDAIKNGATVIVTEKHIEIFGLKKNKISKNCDDKYKDDFAKIKKNFFKNVTQIVVKDVRKAMAIMSANFYKNPQAKIKMIAITGTNGKTSTSFIVANFLKQMKKRVGIVGTSGIFINGKRYPSTMTTPDSVEFFEILSKMVKKSIEYCVVEVSAHAIFFDKVYNVNWLVKALTNVKTDHLDFFKTQKNYEQTKKSFFFEGENFATNGDDKVGKEIKNLYPKKTLSVGFEKGNDYVVKLKKCDFNGTKICVSSKDEKCEFSTNLIGKFNVYNFCLALIILKKLGFFIKNFEKNKQKIKILGRFSLFEYKKRNIIIDYAHTVDALKNLLETIQSVSKNDNIIVFGCPGERETQKRFEMGKLASKFCKCSVITTDNPASENPRRIAFEIMSGCKNQKSHKCVFVENRKLAILHAIKKSKENDNILIVGKGSEDYQIVGDKKIEYCDFDVVKNLLKK